MKIAIPRLLVPAASITIDTASHGAYSVQIVQHPKGISRRVIAVRRTHVDVLDISEDIPEERLPRCLFDGFEVKADVQPDLVHEIVDALVATRDARRVEA
jgi:hypothetical protein